MTVRLKPGRVKALRHAIAGISFSEDRLTCQCGVVMRAAQEAFRDHRMEVRAGPALTEVGHDRDGIRAGGYRRFTIRGSKGDS